MGTDVHVLLDAPDDARAWIALDRTQAEFERLEQMMSRFRPDSELSQLNRAGHIECASHDLVRVIELALEARATTGGLFDPTVHDALLAAGYDRSFEEIVAEDEVGTAPVTCGGDITVAGLRLELAEGTRVDLGGIGKGYAVDRACELLALSGPCLVNAGGDLAVRGGTWPVAVDGSLTLQLENGALATSGSDRRRWQRGGRDQHHLIDPTTGRPAESQFLRVTVVAGTATEADVLAKVAYLGADIEAPRVLLLADGRTVLAGGLG